MNTDGPLRRSTWLLALLVLAGCATVTKPIGEPPAKVTVHREPSSRDSLFPMLFSVDGRPIVRLYPGELYSFELAPGDRMFAYELGVYHCKEDVEISPGETYEFRLTQGCVIEQRQRNNGNINSGEM